MKYPVLAGLTFLVSVAAPANGQSLPLKTTSGTEVGLQLLDYRYEEDLSGSFFMSLQGRKIGLTGGFTRAYVNKRYVNIDARYATGATDYKSAGTGQRSGNPDAYLDMRFMVGQDFDAGSQLLSPYAGLGYRMLINDLRGLTSTGAVGYRRTSTYVYVPIGVTHRFKVSDDARLSTTLEFDPLLEGTQRSHNTDTGAYSDLNNSQRNGHGWRLNLGYETEYWSAGVFYHYWNIEDSEIGLYTDALGIHLGSEPHNITREIGIQIKYRFP